MTHQDLELTTPDWHRGWILYCCQIVFHTDDLDSNLQGHVANCFCICSNIDTFTWQSSYTVYPIEYAQFRCVFLWRPFIINLNVFHLTISFRVASLAMGQSYDCPRASEGNLKDMGKIDLCLIKKKHKPYLYFLGYTVHSPTCSSWIEHFDAIFITTHTTLHTFLHKHE